LIIEAARNERVGFQLGLRNSGGVPQTVRACRFRVDIGG
jgi:hypothetical protein